MSGTHALAGSMQDGRFLTNYSPSCVLNSRLSKELNVGMWNSSEYRANLQRNGLNALSLVQGGPCGHASCSDSGMSISNSVQTPSSPYYADGNTEQLDESKATLIE